MQLCSRGLYRRYIRGKRCNCMHLRQGWRIYELSWLNDLFKYDVFFSVYLQRLFRRCGIKSIMHCCFSQVLLLSLPITMFLFAARISPFFLFSNSASATISEAYANHIVSECDLRSLFWAASAVSEVCDLHIKTAGHKLWVISVCAVYRCNSWQTFSVMHVKC